MQKKKIFVLCGNFFIFAGLNKKTDVLYSCTIVLCSNICELEQDTDKKRNSDCFLGVAAVLISNKIFDNIYGYAVRGTAHTHSGDDRFLATVVFYTSEREDGERITDPEARELFYEIYDICEDQGYLKHSAGKTWKQRVTHFGDSYDRIQIDTMWPAVENYVGEHYDSEDVAREKKVDEITPVSYTHLTLPTNSLV